MNPGGLLLVIGGIWVLAQVFGGNALGRLGISGEPDTIGKAGAEGRSGLDGGGSTGDAPGGGGGGSW